MCSKERSMFLQDKKPLLLTDIMWEIKSEVIDIKISASIDNISFDNCIYSSVM